LNHELTGMTRSNLIGPIIVMDSLPATVMVGIVIPLVIGL
jgi:hypothetical protein